MSKYFLAGGAGFIGSHFLDRLLGEPNAQVVIYDNFTSGQHWHIAHHTHDARLSVIEGDIHDRELLQRSMAGCQCLIHLASNPDIAAAVHDPDIDFRQGTELTRNLAEAVRLNGVPLVLYASGSGIYGELGSHWIQEDHGPLLPISTYGASKLAGEALLCSYAHMFGFRACAFRFANVVGGRQTHGVAFDFLRRLRDNPAYLDILGDGTQSKSYIHVSDVVEAVLSVGRASAQPFDAFNVSTPDFLTVTEIADLVVSVLGLKDVEYRYSGGDRGWKGDIPVVRLDTQKIRGKGWAPRLSTAEALRRSLEEMLVQA